jgi:ribosome biogenesis GTPase A
MSLQWYPGHMTKARRELAALVPSQDVVVEVIDARLPASSSNPVVTEIRGGRPAIKVLAKSDLADPEVTRAWIEAFEREPGVSAFAAASGQGGETRKRLAQLVSRLVPGRGPDKPPRLLVAGVPNAGKSTLINTLVDRPVAKVGDKPAITKVQQRVQLKNGTVITDSPGILWPKIVDESGAFRLALAGSIPDTAIDYITIGMFAAGLFLERYPAAVVARYKLPSTPPTAEALLAEIARRRGGLRAGGVVDLHKASEVLVHEFRAGTLGRLSLESPPT